jgi:hypothetical protein
MDQLRLKGPVRDGQAKGQINHLHSKESTGWMRVIQKDKAGNIQISTMGFLSSRGFSGPTLLFSHHHSRYLLHYL